MSGEARERAGPRTDRSLSGRSVSAPASTTSLSDPIRTTTLPSLRTSSTSPAVPLSSLTRRPGSRPLDPVAVRDRRRWTSEPLLQPQRPARPTGELPARRHRRLLRLFRSPLRPCPEPQADSSAPVPARISRHLAPVASGDLADGLGFILGCQRRPIGLRPHSARLRARSREASAPAVALRLPPAVHPASARRRGPEPPPSAITSSRSPRRRAMARPYERPGIPL